MAPRDSSAGMREKIRANMTDGMNKGKKSPTRAQYISQYRESLLSASLSRNERHYTLGSRRSWSWYFPIIQLRVKYRSCHTVTCEKFPFKNPNPSALICCFASFMLREVFCFHDALKTPTSVGSQNDRRYSSKSPGKMTYVLSRLSAASLPRHNLPTPILFFSRLSYMSSRIAFLPFFSRPQESSLH